MSDLINEAALAQSIITILFGAGLTYYATRYWKRLEARKKLEDEAAAAMKTRNDAADAERQALKVDSVFNKEQHSHFQHANEELHDTLRGVLEKLHKVELDIATRDVRDDATKQTLARIDGQLTRLIDKLLATA